MLLAQRRLPQYAGGIRRALFLSCSTSTLQSASSAVNCCCLHATSFRQPCNALSLAASYSTSTKPLLPNRPTPARRFQFYSHPQLLLPSFDLGRRLANFIMQTYYMSRYEREYSNSGFLRAAEQAVPLVADYIVKEDWQRLKNLMHPDALGDLRQLRTSLSSKEVDKLKFDPDDVVSSFVFASLVTKEWRVKKMFDTSRTIFVNHAVVYILKGQKDWLQKYPRPSSARLLAQQKKNLLVCNIQFSRVIHPVMADWRITTLNFFEPP